MTTESSREQWGSQTGFVLATLGSAVGLGNIWRFSYVVGENGGGAFLLVYLLSVILVGLPMMLAEFALGGHGKTDIVAAFNHPRAAGVWRGVGRLMALAAFLILSYYAVIAGWTLKYFVGYMLGFSAEVPMEEIESAFTRFTASVFEPIVWFALFMLGTITLVAAGVQRGIEAASRVLMPLLAVIVLVLAGYGLSMPGASQAIKFLFATEWTRLTDPNLYLAALGQALFSLGVRVAVLATYATYVPRQLSLPRAAAAAALGDTLFALAAGLVIFPVVFAFALDPAHGPALAFVTLPKVFAQMPGGQWFAAAFFFLLAMAALTSAVALLEVPVAYLMRRYRLRRSRAAIGTGCAALLVGIPSALGSSAWSEVRLLGRPILSAIDHIAAELLLPIGALLTAVFVGWVWSQSEAGTNARISSPRVAALWRASVRWLAPSAMLIVLGVLILQ